ncbi:MAG: ABC transporter ATP-binding protein [Syntrophorhabdaceae bacterium]|nr:ABC transporter ATP-binding protein [Syntrophorhabdaceae bacterium]MDD5243125.1 ABC transporter ATP-binding protein [Syntrophorhabdaceae bacterium]
MKPIIEIRDIGKKYTIGVHRGYLSLREQLTSKTARAVKSLIRGNDKRRKDEFWALRDVSFNVNEGETIGIIGRNGAGKSTLLKILSKITPPTTGKITLRGRVASLLEVGTGFHPELTGRENIYLNGTILGMTRAEISKKFDEIVAFSEIEKFLDTPVKRYSSGMYVRLAFAVAAHLEPEILLVDEVLAVGDAEFQKKCLGKMGDVAQEGRTVLFVSHNMGAIRQLCNSGILLTEGKIAALGKTDIVVDAYLQTIAISHPTDGGVIASNDKFGIALKKVDILNNKGVESPVLQAGTSGSIRLVLETINPQKNLLVSIAVNTLNDTRVCILHTGISDNRGVDLQPPAARLLCHLPKVPFLPGRYRLHIKIAEANGDTIFNVPYAAEIAVEGGDFFGTGRLPDVAWAGVALVEHTWQVT